MLGSPPFKTGDKVRLKTGTSPIKVLEVDYFDCAGPDTTPRWKKRNWSTTRRPMKGWYIRFQYFSSLHYGDDMSSSWREAEDFVFYDQQQEATMPTLYQTKEDKPRFGTMLTKNSKGQIVLEMKGKDGEVEAFDPSQIEEVMPYTVQLTRFVGGNETKPPQRDYEFNEGSVSLGDVLVQLSTGSLWEVTALNSKCRSPSQSKNGFYRLEGKRL